MLLSHQLMDPQVPRVRADETWLNCIRLLGPRGHLVVLDEAGQLAGLLTRTVLEAGERFARAADLAFDAATVTANRPAAVALRKLLSRPEGGVVVVNDQGHPQGLVSINDAVQIARFVLPPRLKVADVMQRGAHRFVALGPVLMEHDEARHGADALTERGGPLPVRTGDNGDLKGTIDHADVVNALMDWLSSSEAMLIDSIP